MPNRRAKFEFEYADLMNLSDWPYTRMMFDVSQGTLDMADIASVCLWLSQNGKPQLRAAMASRILGDLLARARRGGRLETQLAPELLTIAFQEAAADRKKVACKRGRRSKA